MPGLVTHLVLALFALFQGLGDCPPADQWSLPADPTVAAAFDDAFRDSKQGTPQEHEEGGWIYRCQGVNPDDPAEWVTIVERWPPGEKAHIQPTPVSKDPDCELVGDFHTHPGSPFGTPGNDGYANEKPSVEDVEGVVAKGIPGFIIFGLGQDPKNSTVVPYGPTGPMKACEPNPEYGKPPGTGSGTTTGNEGGPGSGESAGDPHLVTFDGRDYDFQASGEFVLVSSSDGSFEIQTRQQPPHAGSHVTSNTAVAVKVDGSVIEVAEDRLVVDGEERPMEPQQTITTPGGGELSGGPGSFVFRWADGTEAHFLGHSLVVRLAEERAGSVGGLLGDFDGDAADDLVGPEGEQLLEDGRLTFRETYESLAGAWAVTEESSLFTYEEGEGPETFSLDEVPGFGLYVDLLPQEQVEEAREVCEAAGVEDPDRLADCVLDVGVTGDESFATEAAQVQEVLTAWRREATPSPPLVEAASRGDQAEVRRLVEEGADLEAVDSSGRTALQWAAYGGHVEIVRDLLQAGADPDHTDDEGDTALHIAATFGLEEVAGLLVDAGADKEISNDSGYTARQVAEQQGNEEIVEVLG